MDNKNGKSDFLDCCIYSEIAEGKQENAAERQKLFEAYLQYEVNHGSSDDDADGWKATPEQRAEIAERAEEMPAADSIEKLKNDVCNFLQNASVEMSKIFVKCAAEYCRENDETPSAATLAKVHKAFYSAVAAMLLCEQTIKSDGNTIKNPFVIRLKNIKHEETAK